MASWCQFVPHNEFLSILPAAEFESLVSIGFIKSNDSKGAFVITAKGSRALALALDRELPTITQTYHAKAIERRLRLSRLMLTAYKAGIEIFTTDIAELQAVPSLFLSAVTRVRGGNPWGGTLVGALLHLPDMVAAMHFVTPGIGRISFVDEINVLVNQSAGIKDAARAFLFAGESYASILTEIESAGQRTDIKLIPYVELMLEVCCSTRDFIRISKEELPTGVVKARFLKLTREHIEYVMDCVSRNTTQIGNIKAYLLAALYNAPVTIGQQTAEELLYRCDYPPLTAVEVLNRKFVAENLSPGGCADLLAAALLLYSL